MKSQKQSSALPSLSLCGQDAQKHFAAKVAELKVNFPLFLPKSGLFTPGKEGTDFSFSPSGWSSSIMSSIGVPT